MGCSVVFGLILVESVNKASFNSHALQIFSELEFSATVNGGTQDSGILPYIYYTMALETLKESLE